MAKINGKQELTDEQVEQIVFDAMRMHGMLPPSVEEVATLDAELDSFKLPFAPMDPNELLKRLENDANVELDATLPFSPSDTPCLRNLAHAAREGDQLTKDTLDQMALDKAKYLQDESNG